MSSHMPKLWRCGAKFCTATDLQKSDCDNPEGLCSTPEAVGLYTHSGNDDDDDDDDDDDAIFRRQLA